MMVSIREQEKEQCHCHAITSNGKRPIGHGITVVAARLMVPVA
jgi:hypothetical protein